MNDHPSSTSVEPSPSDKEEVFHPPFGLKLMLFFVVLLGVFILLDSVARFFR